MNNKLNHIAVILDGNKRWSKKNNLDDIHGYTKGFENIKNLASNLLKKKISTLTVFALSSENFQRSSINIIYEIIYKEFSKTFDELVHEKDVKIKIFGSRKNLPKKLLKFLKNLKTYPLKTNL